jgi:hypothetical protein
MNASLHSSLCNQMHRIHVLINVTRRNQSRGDGTASPLYLREGQFTMNRMSGTLIKLSSITALALGAVAVTSTGFAASAATAPAVDDPQA